jgi:hypothetical protein
MLVLLLGITPPGINNSVEYAAYREADTALWYDSGNSQKSGRFQPERVAALNRITRQVYSGMGGSFAPDFPRKRKKMKTYILIHGNSGSKKDLFFLEKELSHFGNVLNLDLPCHGKANIFQKLFLPGTDLVGMYLVLLGQLLQGLLFFQGFKGNLGFELVIETSAHAVSPLVFHREFHLKRKVKLC